jgi:hypothetical protein
MTIFGICNYQLDGTIYDQGCANGHGMVLGRHVTSHRDVKPIDVVSLLFFAILFRINKNSKNFQK